MSKIQSGSGYGFTSSGYGFSLNTEKPFNEPQKATGCLPLRVTYDSYDPDGNSHFFTVCSGMVNNLVPQILEDGVWIKLDRVTGGALDPPVGVINVTAGLGMFYLRCGNVTGPPSEYPTQDDTLEGYPRIISEGGTTAPLNDDTYSYIVLASVVISDTEVATLTPYVQSSLWSERFKCGSSGTNYWWSAV